MTRFAKVFAICFVSSALCTAVLCGQTFRILYPTVGQELMIGEIEVVAEIPPGITDVALGSSPSSGGARAGSASNRFRMSLNAVGPVQLILHGRTGNTYLTSTPVTIQVAVPPCTLQTNLGPGLLVLPYVGFQHSVQLYCLTNEISPNFQRRIAIQLSPEVVFTTSDPRIAVVNTGGLLTAHGKGSALLRAAFRGSFWEIPITVRSDRKGDLDLDNDIDQADINIVTGMLNQPASSAGDVRDINGDGKIDTVDLRQLVARCTRQRCSEQ